MQHKIADNVTQVVEDILHWDKAFEPHLAKQHNTLDWRKQEHSIGRTTQRNTLDENIWILLQG